jgi:hypothetical protein
LLPLTGFLPVMKHCMPMTQPSAGRYSPRGRNVKALNIAAGGGLASGGWGYDGDVYVPRET